jgi:hypothetical protein
MLAVAGRFHCNVMMQIGWRRNVDNVDIVAADRFTPIGTAFLPAPSGGKRFTAA